MYIYQANDITLSRSVIDQDESVVDLTGATITYRITRPGSDTALAELSTSTSGVTITDAAAGEYEVELSDTDTDLAPDDYVHEVLIELSSGAKYTALRETLTIRDSAFSTS